MQFSNLTLVLDAKWGFKKKKVIVASVLGGIQTKVFFIRQTK